MTAVQLALDCEATWTDPEPDDEDNGPWCTTPLDLWGQRLHTRRTSRITTVPITGSYL